MSISDSLVFQSSDALFDQLTDQLRAKLKAIPPSENDSTGAKSLYQEFRRECVFEASDQCRERWIYTITGIAEQLVAELPAPLQRLLYAGTDNGGEECVHLAGAEQIVMSGPWVQQELVNRLGWP